MAVEVDMEQLDKLQEKMKQTDELFLKKMEKATTILPKGVEKVDHAWLKMVSKVGVYVDKLIQHTRSGIELICSKMDEMKNILSGIRDDLAEIEKAIDKGTLVQGFITLTASVLSVSATFLTAKGSVVAFAAALSPLLLLLGKGALIVGTFIAALKFTDWILEITGARKYIDDFMFWVVDKFINIKDEIVEGINYLVDYPAERLYVFKEYGKNVINYFREGLLSAWGGVKNLINDKVDWLKDKLQFRKSPPFSIIYGYGLRFMEAFCQGIMDKTPLLESTLDTVAAKAEAILQIPVEALATGSLSKSSGLSAGAGSVLMPLKDDFKNFYHDITSFEKDAQQKSLTGWKFWADSIIDFFSSIHGGIQGTYESLKGGFSDIFNIFKGPQVSPDFVGPVQEQGLFSKIGAALGPIGKVAGVIMQIQQIIKQVWASIKDFAKGIASLFGWMTEEEKVQKDVLRDLGAAISDDLAKKIADASKDLGDRFSAVTLHLGDIMRETDITGKNFDSFASRAHDVFSLLETGMIDATMATSTLNDVFPQLADEMDKLGITFNKNMIDMIQLSRQFGLEVQSIKQYVEEKLGIAVQGLTKATQNLGEIGQAEFERLARAASATFQELMKNGSDIASAIDQMKEVIANLGKAQEEHGLKGSAAFNQLKRYGNLVETNRSVIESVKGMTDVYTSLAQVGAMNQQLFTDWQQDSLANYDKLIAGGFKQNEALAMMAPTLQSLKEAHETMGYKIDDNTRALIEQAEAAGLLKADPMIEMRDAVIEMKDAVYDLIDHISGHSPPCGSLIEAFGTAVEYTKSYGRELINAFSPLPVQTLINEIGEIPKDIGIHVGYTYDEYAGPYGGKYGGSYGYGGGTGPGGKPYYAAQHGGIFTVPTHLLVGENPAYNPEVVLNRFQLERLLTKSPGPGRNLNEKDGKPAVIVNKLYLNGKEIAQCIKELSQDGLLSIDERAIKT